MDSLRGFHDRTLQGFYQQNDSGYSLNQQCKDSDGVRVSHPFVVKYCAADVIIGVELTAEHDHHDQPEEGWGGNTITQLTQ